MPSSEYQEGHENLTNELIDKIVQFYFRTSTGWPLTVILRIVPLFTSIEKQNIIIGDFIAGETNPLKLHGIFSKDFTSIVLGRYYLLKERITGYKIVTVRDFPLFIGYPHKSPLFDKLLKG